MTDPQLDFKDVWRRLAEPPEPEPDSTPCAIATDFARKIEEILFRPLETRPSRGQIAQGEWLLQREWHAWRNALRPSHARHGRHERGHHCLDEAYHAAYSRLRLLELTLRPPALIADYDALVEQANLRVPAPVPPVPQPAPLPEQVFGVGIGEAIIDPKLK